MRKKYLLSRGLISQYRGTDIVLNIVACTSGLMDKLEHVVFREGLIVYLSALHCVQGYLAA